MTDTIREMLQRQPFVPFRITLTSGDKYEISDPELAVLMQTELFVAEPRSDHFHLLRLNQIAAIERLSQAA